MYTHPCHLTEVLGTFMRGHNSNLFMISAPMRGNYRRFLPLGRYLVTVATISAQPRPRGYLMCLQLFLLRTTNRILKTESHIMNEFGTY
ncbi:hypothetical protein K443DRAFT_447418 [Laccaria amethystina LaAM-08-1]|uniref:Uncharacterized protein n=1 Tax=Laccaria amethystina LaAM-08-1 TaxID=1095629 RepID=A0A0C9YFE2_9AGAR|nr:hypothetical protein K443DRAFT_447418 [Laccaria amethystina LaAM-08-1]